ncbi:DUF6808 domain-containing protein [uncultured Duncaniella sp.]|uniref:DUF6808 domain-containing protein n=1 Tax=uncultured Duncaniella sp. TaxID=2768039 RepID=UPI002731ED88|nr:hypothetical protein [uncultured Duncaniella sp.]
MRGDTIRKVIRKVKNILAIVFILAICILAGAYLHKCQSSPGTEQNSSCVVDTITYTDTIPYYEPRPKQEVSLGTKIVFLPVSIPKDSTTQDVPQDGNIVMENIPEEIPDTVAVEIPIIQKEYEGEDYHAWVSGYEPKMDSIYVFPRHETVTIREPPNKPKRWGIGVFAGYGMTPQGLQPCAGLSINYTLWNF